MRAIFSYGVALVLILLIALWLSSGTLIQGGNGPGQGTRQTVEAIEGEDGGPLTSFLAAIGLGQPDEVADAVEAEPEMVEEAADTETLRSVRTRTSVAEPLAVYISVRGRTEANARISARAETSDIVETVHVAKGDLIAKGDLLCTLEKGTRQSKVAQAEASLAQVEADLETNTALRAKGVVPENTARALEVAVKAARAGLADAKTELGRTEIRAEIGGVVQDPLASTGDMLSAGAVCATIAQLDPMLFVGKIAEAKIAQVKEGMAAGVRTVTGQDRLGSVRYISASADDATRSFPIEIEMSNADGALLDGVTADAAISVGETPAHLMPQSALTLNNNGDLGVRTVVDGELVKFLPVTIVRDDPDGIWVSGLPDEIALIIVGQDYVVDGQHVAATLVEGDLI